MGSQGGESSGGGVPHVRNLRNAPADGPAAYRHGRTRARLLLSLPRSPFCCIPNEPERLQPRRPLLAQPAILALAELPLRIHPGPQLVTVGRHVALRQLRKGKGGGLSEERTARLEALGFVWDPNDAAWDESYRRLEAYRAEHGDCFFYSRTKQNIFPI